MGVGKTIEEVRYLSRELGIPIEEIERKAGGRPKVKVGGRTFSTYIDACAHMVRMKRSSISPVLEPKAPVSKATRLHQKDLDRSEKVRLKNSQSAVSKDSFLKLAESLGEPIEVLYTEAGKFKGAVVRGKSYPSYYKARRRLYSIKRSEERKGRTGET